MSFDHVALAESRLIAEYRDKPKMKAWVTISAQIASIHLEPAAEQITNSYDVDTVEGNSLDVIGVIVGVIRPIIRISEYQVFGYDGNPDYTNYNVAPYVGGDDPVQDQPMSDFLYRKLIKAKIARNISDASIDSIIQLAEFVLGFDVVALLDYQDMSFALAFSQEPDLATQFLIDNFDIIPRPQGVEMKPWFVYIADLPGLEAATDHLYNYANYTLPGDVA